ncbi:phosphotransferase tpt1 [Cyclospora cayetanensis]|uniref:Phosphotransferase tpt1 n=1 Tax=Cyclospora cayetanensis TaxID=88456 RepID=A0A1D3D5T8_9EIME|nr:phosphotransferase tpt1 [Cyclospora cayetanensis]
MAKQRTTRCAYTPRLRCLDVQQQQHKALSVLLEPEQQRQQPRPAPHLHAAGYTEAPSCKETPHGSQTNGLILHPPSGALFNDNRHGSPPEIFGCDLARRRSTSRHSGTTSNGRDSSASYELSADGTQSGLECSNASSNCSAWGHTSEAMNPASPGGAQTQKRGGDFEQKQEKQDQQPPQQGPLRWTSWSDTEQYDEPGGSLPDRRTEPSAHCDPEILTAAHGEDQQQQQFPRRLLASSRSRRVSSSCGSRERLCSSMRSRMHGGSIGVTGSNSSSRSDSNTFELRRQMQSHPHAAPSPPYVSEEAGAMRTAASAWVSPTVILTTKTSETTALEKGGWEEEEARVHRANAAYESTATAAAAASTATIVSTTSIGPSSPTLHSPCDCETSRQDGGSGAVAAWQGYLLIKKLNFILRHGASLFRLPMREDGFAVSANFKQRYELLYDEEETETCPALSRTHQQQQIGLAYGEAGGVACWHQMGVGGLLRKDGCLLATAANAATADLEQHGGGGRQTSVDFATGFPGDASVLSGMRRNSEVAVYIDVKRAMQAGVVFFRSANGVVLTEGLEGKIPSVRKYDDGNSTA